MILVKPFLSVQEIKDFDFEAENKYLLLNRGNTTEYYSKYPYRIEIRLENNVVGRLQDSFVKGVLIKPVSILEVVTSNVLSNNTVDQVIMQLNAKLHSGGVFSSSEIEKLISFWNEYRKKGILDEVYTPLLSTFSCASGIMPTKIITGLYKEGL